MEDDLVCSYYESLSPFYPETYQPVPDSGMHYKVLVFQSKRPIQLTVTIESDEAQMKELKSHDGDKNCLLERCFVGKAIRHLGTTVAPSRAKAIWDTINVGDEKPEIPHGTSTPVENSSPDSSFAIIGHPENYCVAEQLNQASLEAGERSSIPAISEASSFAQIKEDDKLEPEDYIDEEWFSEESEPDVHDASGSDHMLPSRYGYRDSANAIATLEKIAKLPEKTETDELVKSMRQDEAAEVSQQQQLAPSPLQKSQPVETVSPDSETNEPSFRTPPEEGPERKLENLILMVLEYMTRITETLKDSAKPLISPQDLTVNYFNRVLDSEAFMELAEEQLDKVLDLKRTVPELEASLTRGVVRWSEYKQARKEALPKFLAKCQLETLRVETLVELSKINSIRYSIDCRDVIDLYKNNLLLAISSRKPQLPNDFLYVMTHDRTRTWENHIYQINLHDKSAQKIATRQAILLASSRNCLFVFARRNITQRAIDIFQFATKEWTTMNNWPSDLLITSMCTYNRCIYFTACIGSSHNFYKFDPSIDEFRMIIPPSQLTLKDNEKIIPYDKHILFVPSGFAYHPVRLNWNNFAKFETRFSTSILAVHNDRIIFPFGNDLLRWFDPKTGNHDCHSNWYNSTGTNGQLIDLTVINNRFYLVEKFLNGLNIMIFNGHVWDTFGWVDLQSEPMRCAIATDDY